jgi:hypothetical protein
MYVLYSSLLEYLNTMDMVRSGYDDDSYYEHDGGGANLVLAY